MSVQIAGQLDPEDSFDLRRSRLEHQDALVDHRLQWLSTSQAFLAAAYVLLFDRSVDEPPAFLWAVPSLGIAVCICIYVSIIAAVNTANNLSHGLADREKLYPGSRSSRFLGNFAPLVLPLIFIVAWILALAYERIA